MSSSRSPQISYEIIEQEKEAYLEEEFSAPDSEWPPDVREVYNIMWNRLFEIRLDVKTVLEQCRGCTNSSTRSRFQYFVGCTIKEFIIHHRLEMAKRLLHRENLSITKIALSIGYSTPSGFSTTFKRREGIPPSTMRDKEN
jgi:AraC-like DNA-binding protein